MNAWLGPTLEIDELGDQVETARLSDYFFPKATTAWALFARADGGRTFIHAQASSRGSKSEWAVRQFLVAPPAAAQVVLERALDLTIFECDESAFVERERYQASQGPNLHAQPIALPAILRRDDWCRPFPDRAARVTLSYAGQVRLRLAGAALSVRAIRLTAEQEHERRIQWMVEGVGEVAIGAEHGGFQRWLLGWSCQSGRVLFGGAGEFPEASSLPSLPERAGPTRATKSIL
ncbi:MAG TPA: hypothetical protein VGP93_03240 [Polyangiaceae bacterium]|nr:hypothetical protein [Polyangiaceae bacterium]